MQLRYSLPGSAGSSFSLSTLLRANPTAALALLLVVALLPSACSMTDETDEAHGTETGNTGEAGSGNAAGGGTFTLSGKVVRAVEASDDGRGILYVGAFATCEHGAPVLGAYGGVADVAAPDAEAAFTITGLPEGTVFLAAFLDDDGNADQGAPEPDAGDLVFADDPNDGVLSCVTVQIAGGDASGVTITLNALKG